MLSQSLGTSSQRDKKVLTLFGTRPEVIKLAPVIEQLEARRGAIQTVNVTSAQGTVDRLIATLASVGHRTKPGLVFCAESA